MVDCILCYAATYLVEQMTDPSNDAGRVMLERVRNDARGSKQVCVISNAVRGSHAWLELAVGCILLRRDGSKQVRTFKSSNRHYAAPDEIQRASMSHRVSCTTPVHQQHGPRTANAASACRCWSWRTCTPRRTAPAWRPCDLRCSASGTRRRRSASAPASPFP